MLIYSNCLTCTTNNVIHLDFQKASDSVSNEELLIQRWNIGTTGSLWIMLKNYMTNRCQLSSINGVSSFLLPVTSGVLQRRILGPQLSPIYVNDLHLICLKSSLLMFVDTASDCTLNRFLLPAMICSSFGAVIWKLAFNPSNENILCFQHLLGNIAILIS